MTQFIIHYQPSYSDFLKNSELEYDDNFMEQNTYRKISITSTCYGLKKLIEDLKLNEVFSKTPQSMAFIDELENAYSKTCMKTVIAFGKEIVVKK